MTLKILNHQEKEQLIERLNNQFGIKNIPDSIIKTGADRFVLFTGDLNILKKLESLRVIEGIGNYVAREQLDEIRLSIEGTHLLKEEIKKNIIELDKEQTEQWMHGQQVDIKTGKKGFVVIKYKEDFLGTGKASEEKIGNFIPKNRRLKNKEL